jgi:hypothetical protein
LCGQTRRPERQRVVVRDKLDPLAERGADLVRELASSVAVGEHPEVMVFERPALDERQEPMFGADSIEPVYDVKNPHAFQGADPR